MLQSPTNWSNVCEAAKRITSELQRCWDEERAILAAQAMLEEPANRLDPEAVRCTRNDLRNVARRTQTVRQREEQRGERPSMPSSSPRTSERRANIRARMARLRQRHRQHQQDERRGVEGGDIERGESVYPELASSPYNLVEVLGLSILNNGSAPTFIGRGAARPSVIDVIFATPSLVLHDTWEVLDFARSDHQLIRFETNSPALAARRVQLSQRNRSQQRSPRRDSPINRQHTPCAGRRWKTKQFSENSFLLALRDVNFAEQAVTDADIVEMMTRACDEVMQRANHLSCPATSPATLIVTFTGGLLSWSGYVEYV